MTRLLLLLLLTTVALPPITGLVAVLSGFGDPWGMGSKDPLGIFVSAALPVLVPGIYQIVAWPLTFGVALLLVPLAALRQGRWYLLVLLLYLAAIVAAWLFNWATAPDYLNALIDGRSYVPGRLNSNLWKLGVFLLTDSAMAAAAVTWWYLRRP